MTHNDLEPTSPDELADTLNRHCKEAREFLKSALRQDSEKYRILKTHLDAFENTLSELVDDDMGVYPNACQIQTPKMITIKMKIEEKK